MPPRDPDLDALMATILRDPGDDTARLVYADRLDEIGTPATAAFAEFIRASIDRHRLGGRPLELHGVLEPRGPDYFEMLEGDCPVKVGDRVDVSNHVRRNVPAKEYPGLLVTKVIVDDPALDTVRLALKRDEHSKPWPRKRAKALDKRREQLWRSHERDFVDAAVPLSLRVSDRLLGYAVTSDVRLAELDYGPDGVAAVAFPPRLESAAFAINSVRGFPSQFVGPLPQWVRWGDSLVKNNPISSVAFDSPVAAEPGLTAVSLKWLASRWPSVPAGGFQFTRTEENE